MAPTFAPPGAAILFGYGSIGRVHARALATMPSPLVIVDGKAEARAAAQAQHPTATVVEDLKDVDGLGVAWLSVLAAIATWGPSHAALFDALVDRGVRRILCEKPLATSVERAEAMVSRARRDGVVLVSNHHLRNSGFIAGLQRLADRHQLGQPVAIIVDGGAACLVTNGLHWVDFAIQVFGSTPRRVVGTARGEAINPRAPDLHLYGGSAVWSFDGDRELTLAFSNRSSVYPTTRIYYRDAVVTIDCYYYDVVLRRRDPTAVEKFPAITRTGAADEVIFQGQLPGLAPFEEALALGHRALAEGHVGRCPADAAATAVAACIGALIAGREGRSVDLPVDPLSAWGLEPWPIS